MLLRSLVCVALLFGGAFAHAQLQFPIDHQKDRILPDLDNIDRFIERSKGLENAEMKMSFFDNENLRDSLRDLQNLMRLYAGKLDPENEVEDRQKTYGALLGYYESIKEFEDHISHLRDYKSFYRTAQNSGNRPAIRKFKKILDDEIESYTNFLENSKWFAKNGQTKTQEMRQTVEALEWPSLEKDRNHFLKKMAKKMGKIHKKEYDMNLVEDGMHELRRDARRLTYLNLPVRIVQSSRGVACPIDKPIPDELERKGDTYQCFISDCLMREMNTASRTLARLKSQGARFEARGEHVPQSILDQAQIVHDVLKNKKIFLHVEIQLKECRTPKRGE